jgi:hypothetical protein
VKLFVLAILLVWLVLLLLIFFITRIILLALVLVLLLVFWRLRALMSQVAKFITIVAIHLGYRLSFATCEKLLLLAIELDATLVELL